MKESKIKCNNNYCLFILFIIKIIIVSVNLCNYWNNHAGTAVWKYFIYQNLNVLKRGQKQEGIKGEEIDFKKIYWKNFKWLKNRINIKWNCNNMIDSTQNRNNNNDNN